MLVNPWLMIYTLCAKQHFRISHFRRDRSGILEFRCSQFTIGLGKKNNIDLSAHEQTQIIILYYFPACSYLSFRTSQPIHIFYMKYCLSQRVVSPHTNGVIINDDSWGFPTYSTQNTYSVCTQYVQHSSQITYSTHAISSMQSDAQGGWLKGVNPGA